MNHYQPVTNILAAAKFGPKLYTLSDTIRYECREFSVALATVEVPSEYVYILHKLYLGQYSSVCTCAPTVVYPSPH